MYGHTETEIYFSSHEPVQEIGESMKIEEYIVPENVIPIIRNKQVLEELPESTPFVNKEDLVVLFRIEIPSVIEDQVNLIQVTDKMMESWGMSVQDIYERSLKNMQERDYIKIYTMDSVIGSMMLGTEEQEVSEEILEQIENPFLVVTSKNHMNGAVGILDTNKLREISEMIGDDLYILPSSIHECLLLPKDKIDIQDLRKMVADINEREVAPEERLSDNVYEYLAATKEIAIAGNDLRKKESVEHIR